MHRNSGLTTALLVLGSSLLTAGCLTTSSSTMPSGMPGSPPSSPSSSPGGSSGS